MTEHMQLVIGMFGALYASCFLAMVVYEITEGYKDWHRAKRRKTK